MFIFLPKTKERDEFFVTDSIILYLFYNLLHALKRRKNK